MQLETTFKDKSLTWYMQLQDMENGKEMSENVYRIKPQSNT
jgi:hypothetical protein